MTDSSSAAAPIADRCPWCSAPLTDSQATTCPSCGAALREQVEGDLPGVTQIDAAAIVGQRKLRRKGVRELIGLTDDETEGSPPRALPTPPSEEVRREMLRLRIDALEAEIEAQAAALAAARAEAAAAGIVLDADVPTEAPADATATASSLAEVEAEAEPDAVVDARPEQKADEPA